MSRFESLGHYVYEDGNRIGCTPEEASAELARKLNAYQMRIERFKAENARLKAEVERLTKDNETINKDRALLWASHKIALQDIQGLHYALQTAKEGKQS
jgi:FtsZ-binding cell division protein ZapB